MGGLGWFFDQIKYIYTHIKKEPPFITLKKVIIKYYPLKIVEVWFKSTSTEINHILIVDQINACISKSWNSDLPVFDGVIWNWPLSPPPSLKPLSLGNYVNSSKLAIFFPRRQPYRMSDSTSGHHTSALLPFICLRPAVFYFSPNIKCYLIKAKIYLPQKLR